ncbi:alpha-ketoglutarate decarboxylase [Cellulophaga fucicola]|uniref:Alpha-ketoglutarate decarboxylase n=1 Tax=Cellulophaga fucicola TaxID=76595 RepID=A0A1K1PGD4_9FLAO|nr:alpha-ketoglutarate decarboxylase [Cellulophaga fucicola]SFW46850.1 hypothetical protein SAMN05660313_01884 [Cellulophaga fucicola]
MIKNNYFFSKILVFSILITAFTTNKATSQRTNSSSNFWDNVHFGGGLGVGFGNDSFNAAVSPSAIYQVNQMFAVGTGLSFNYSKYGDSKLIAYGASALTLFNVIPQIQLSAEFEELRINREFGFNGSTIDDDYWNPALYLGLGYSNQNVTIGLRYDVLHDDEKSINFDALMPFVRVYF